MWCEEIRPIENHDATVVHTMGDHLTKRSDHTITKVMVLVGSPVPRPRKRRYPLWGGGVGKQDYQGFAGDDRPRSTCRTGSQDCEVVTGRIGKHAGCLAMSSLPDGNPHGGREDGGEVLCQLMVW